MTGMSENTFTAVIDHLERMNNSKNGNPRYRVYVVDGPAYPTAPDAAISYALPNPEYRGVPVTFTVNGRGWIIDAYPAEKKA